MINMLYFKYFGLKYSLYRQNFMFWGLRNYVLGLEFPPSQPQNSSGIWSLTPECSGILGFSARPYIEHCCDYTNKPMHGFACWWQVVLKFSLSSAYSSLQTWKWKYMYVVFEEIFLIHTVTITLLTIDTATVCLFFILAKYWDLAS